jgi:hypothetical protein
MASLSHGNTHSRFAVICADGEGVPISFPMGNDGFALITSLRLSLRFQFNEEFMFIDEEVFNAYSGDLIHTIGKSLVSDRSSKQWLLKPGRFRVYGMNELVMATSTELVTPHWSSTYPIQPNLPSRVKVEQHEELITILSDDSDGNSPMPAAPIRPLLVDTQVPDSPERTPIFISPSAPHIGHQQPLSVVDSLKKLRASKDARNAFRSLNYDVLDM